MPDLLLQIFLQAKKVDQKALHSCVFILQKNGFDFPWPFKSPYEKEGPYSPDLENDIGFLLNGHFIKNIPEENGNFYCLNDESELIKPIEQANETQAELINILKDKPIELLKDSAIIFYHFNGRKMSNDLDEKRKITKILKPYLSLNKTNDVHPSLAFCLDIIEFIQKQRSILNTANEQ